MFDKWYKEYIENIDIKNIEWIKMNADKLAKFLKDNYYDATNKSLVYDNENFVPYGMYYLNFFGLPGFKYILGITDNNIGKKTILGCIAYIDNYKLFDNQIDYITYFSTIEVNKFFRGLGIATNLIKETYKYINPYQNILISELSPMGRESNLLNKTIDIFRERGFYMDIRSDIDNFDFEEYHDLLVKKKRLR